ncbi:MAG: multidrug ABC transporter ATP-binding protein [Flavobacteriaceae bacterium]|nr:multidrug ABC transporter ATP-binding protein [Flavobacteriaceae bacterium]|tara:strand:+ start:2622 stop:3317 length:696 start_codon:yes stop_codon:yes gene_type:complete
MNLFIKNLIKYYGEKKALNKVTFDLKKSQIIGLLGPNGAGKTTLMRILSGSIIDWEGTINYNEFSLPQDINHFKQKIGYLPENNPLYKEMYVKEYLWFCKQFYKGKGLAIEDLINRTGLEKCKKQKIKELSKGYRQRVGIAASIFHNPEILLLDEPTTGLDPNQTLEIRNLIKSLSKDKIVLISSHILQEIEAMCNRVIILNNGEVILDDSLSNIQKKKIKLEKLFSTLTK